MIRKKGDFTIILIIIIFVNKSENFPDEYS